MTRSPFLAHFVSNLLNKRRMLGKPAWVMLHFDGRMVIRHEGKDLGFREIPDRPKRTSVAPALRPKPPKYIPPPTHPWRLQRLSEHASVPEAI